MDSVFLGGQKKEVHEPLLTQFCTETHPIQNPF